MWSKAFWKAATERAVKTAAQAPLAAFFVGDVALNAFTVDWEAAAGLALGGAVASLLTSLAFGANGSGPSAGPEQLAPQADR